jgi:hypothetical protein
MSSSASASQVRLLPEARAFISGGWWQRMLRYRLDGARGALCGELSKMCGGCDDDVVRAPVLACENTKKASAERSEPLQVRRAYAGG